MFKTCIEYMSHPHTVKIKKITFHFSTFIKKMVDDIVGEDACFVTLKDCQRRFW